MPRKRQTLTGEEARPNVPVAGQTYGAGVDQQQLETSLPTPGRQNVPPTPPPAQQQPQQQTAARPVLYDHDAALAAASQLSDQTGILSADTVRPNEPITAGLSRGPGPGPEALGLTQGSPTGDLFRRLSAATGDPFFANLAAKAQA